MTEKPKIVFANGALPADADQEMIDAITAAISAHMNGDDLPEWVEICSGENATFDEEEIAQVLEQYAHLPSADLEQLEAAMREGDMEVFTDILVAASEGGELH